MTGYAELSTVAIRVSWIFDPRPASPDELDSDDCHPDQQQLQDDVRIRDEGREKKHGEKDQAGVHPIFRHCGSVTGRFSDGEGAATTPRIAR